jgi:CRISPR type III-A-associated RAMP protein Csm5
MTAIKSTQQVTLEVLTPLHIGSGRADLLNDLDYVSGERLYVIDQERMLAALPTSKLRQAEQAAPLSRLLTDDEQRRYARYTLNNPQGRRPVPRVIDQIKRATGEPYVPGSSLKGVVRTALVRAALQAEERMVQRHDLGYNPRFADDPLVGRLLGKDPNRDLLRALQIADSDPVAPEGSLDLVQIALYTLRGNPMRLTPKGEGWSFFVEVVQPGTRLTTTVGIDDFLLQNRMLRHAGMGGHADLVRQWLVHCHAFSQAIIAHERAFYTRHGLPELATFYADLEARATRLAAQGSTVVQMSWGTGWLSKTLGPTLEADTLADIRDQFRLGRQNVPIFPKTRRLVEQNGAPVAPPGWVALHGAGGKPLPDIPPPIVREEPEPRPAPDARPRRIADLRPGMVLEGVVRQTVAFGAFVDIGVGRDGLIHISQLADRRVAEVEDVVQIGQTVRVRVLDVDIGRNRISLSLRGVG